MVAYSIDGLVHMVTLVHNHWCLSSWTCPLFSFLSQVTIVHRWSVKDKERRGNLECHKSFSQMDQFSMERFWNPNCDCSGVEESFLQLQCPSTILGNGWSDLLPLEKKVLWWQFLFTSWISLIIVGLEMDLYQQSNAGKKHLSFICFCLPMFCR